MKTSNSSKCPNILHTNTAPKIFIYTKIFQFFLRILEHIQNIRTLYRKYFVRDIKT